MYLLHCCFGSVTAYSDFGLSEEKGVSSQTTATFLSYYRLLAIKEKQMGFLYIW
jgi:hypothetical protein